MNCTICKTEITPSQEYLKDYCQDTTKSYHVVCHLQHFGDIIGAEEAKATKYKVSYEAGVGSLANYVFLIILIIGVIFMLVWLIYLAV